MLIFQMIKDDPDQGGGPLASEHVQEIHSIYGDIFRPKKYRQYIVKFWTTSWIINEGIN